MSLIDRSSLSVVAQPLMAELRLTDSQLGLLIGVAFGALYGIMSLPIAHVLDRGRRIHLVSIGAVIWGLASIGSAFAADFPGLAVCRGLLAIAEAVLTPAALSLIPDLFRSSRRALPVAIFSAMTPIALPLALLAGGAALAFGAGVQPITGLPPWRMTLALLGLPSVLLGLLLWLTVREPARRGEGGERQDLIGTREALGFGRRNFRFYGGYLVGVSAQASAFVGAATWVPTALVRAFDVPPADAARTLGLVTLPAALAGSILWPLVANRLELRGMVGARGLALVVIALALTVLGSSLWVLPIAGVVAAFGLMSFVFGGMAANVALNLQTMTPPRMRARAATIYPLCGGAVASMVGPSLVAGIGERLELTGASSALLSAISLVWAGFGVIAILAFLIALKPLQAAARRELELEPTTPATA